MSRLDSATDKIIATDHQGNSKNFYVTLCKDKEEQLKSLVFSCGKAGSEERGSTQAMGRLVTLLLEHNVKPDVIAKTLRGTDGGLRGKYNNKQIKGSADILAVALMEGL